MPTEMHANPGFVANSATYLDAQETARILTSL